jgi:uncharacterized protein (DUF1800 family)
MAPALPATPAQFTAVTLQSFLTMDAWLPNLTVSAPKETLNSVLSQAEVIDAKPATAVDLCDVTGDPTFSTPVSDTTVCDADPWLVKHSSPRQVAAGRRASSAGAGIRAVRPSVLVVPPLAWRASTSYPCPGTSS